MTRRKRIAMSAAMILVALAVALYLRWSAGLYPRWAKQCETPTMRAYNMCARCAGLRPDEVDGLIDTGRTAPGTREDKLRLFSDQFDDPVDAKLCAPCTEAILDAADTWFTHLSD